MKIYVKLRYKKEITVEIINKILASLGLPAKYTIEYDSGNGRNIIIETDDKSIFVILSRKEVDSRNGFLAQYIPTVLEQYIKYDSTKQKSIYIYLLNTTNSAKTQFILDTYRVSKTLGINIINESELQVAPIQPYTTFKDWKYAKSDRQKYNPSNKASYAIEDENEYTVFGKLYGANLKDAVLMGCSLAQIAKAEKKNLNFVQVKEHGTDAVPQETALLLKYYGVSISENSIILQDKDINDKSTCRKQDEFKYNLLEKYGEKKCYLCGCDIESNIIASHIHRITDIDHSNLTETDKRKQAVDGDNGFWLCANHDKFFEYGIITFNKQGKLVINPNLKENQIKFVKHITDVMKIEDKHLNNNLIKYLLIHNQRVNLGV